MAGVVNRLREALADRYQLEREIGSGGMATVYLAQDLKHDRKVAVKVLKPELAAVMGTERFLAEIRTTANLSHPRILPLHDSGEADGFLFYVMPYVEGESLQQRLGREGQIPVEEAVRVAGHVADALDSAHRHGVIHRDLKPANILFQEGEPVVADFGIALAVSTAGEGRLTETGLSLGTPFYMSPEQAAGNQTPTPASDVYSLGCVLYEMLTGDPPHTGSSAQAVLGKVLLGEVISPSKLRRTIPPNVEGAILKALEPMPSDRFRSVSAMASALTDPGFRHAADMGVTVAQRKLPVKGALGLVALGGLGLGFLLGWLIFGQPEPPDPVSRYVLDVPGGLRSDGLGGSSMTVSPDGSQIVYVGTVPGGQRRQLFLRERDRLTEIPLSGTEDALSPVFSPDGSKVAFHTPNPPALVSIELEGEVPVTLATGPLEIRGLSWGTDGYIYAGGRAGIMRVPEDGGSFDLVTTVDTDAGERRHIYPQALPHGRGLLFANVYTPSEEISNHEVAVVDFKTGERRTLLSGLGPRYLPTGHLAHVALEGTLMVTPFDLRTLTTTGPSVPVAEDLRVGPYGVVNLLVTKPGDLMYQIGAAGGAENEILRVSRTGEATPIDSRWKEDFRSLSLSPDSSRLAVEVGGGQSTDIWMRDLKAGTQARFTLEGNWNARPSWSPDGSSLTFVSRRGGNADVFSKPTFGGGRAQVLVDEDRGVFEAFHSPDKQWLIFRTVSNSAGGGDILAIGSGGENIPIPLVASEHQEWSPGLSPNGRWLAYISDETGQFEVYVVPFPETKAAKWMVSVGGGTEPMWAHSGRELFYRNGRDEMVSVEVQASENFTHGRQQVLFSATSYRPLPGHQGYTVSPDDEWFFVIRTAGFDQVAELVVVENWFQELTVFLGG